MMDNELSAIFSNLSPDRIITAAEQYAGFRFDGTITPYNSYVNRVFGLTAEDGKEYIIKFYRYGRWSVNAILDEHHFLTDCADIEVPVVPPLYAVSSPATLAPTLARTNDGLLYTLFPRLKARTFDIYCDDDWLRTGRAIGRMHRAARSNTAPYRIQCTPQQTTTPYITYLLTHHLVTPELVVDFTSICDNALDYVEDAYRTCFGETDRSGRYTTNAFMRIHGDCHRGNILEQCISPSPATDTEDCSIITFIDFDDMMTGPAMQDIWLLLPGYRKDSMQQLNLLIEGYEEFGEDWSEDRTQKLSSQLRLIEPLRFMRNIYFLAWTAIQHNDEGFLLRNPDWGSKAFWEKEIEDLSTQCRILKEDYEYFTT